MALKNSHAEKKQTMRGFEVYRSLFTATRGQKIRKPWSCVRTVAETNRAWIFIDNETLSLD
jgi:hypothetical protein